MLKCLRRKGGFTLIEMLLVILIVGFLVGILVIRASDVGEDAKKKSVAADLKSLKTAVEIYYVEYSCFPSDNSNWEDELVGSTPRLIDEVPVDPYGSADYVYETDGGDPITYYAIYSVGPDGTAGTLSVTTTDNGTVTHSDDNLWVSNCYGNNHSFD